MIRRILASFAVLGFIAMLLGTVGFLYYKSIEPEEVFETASLQTRDIILQTVATGAIEPRNQVDIKGRVSGVLKEVLVKPGELVDEGDLLATVKVIPDSASLNNAKSRVSTSKISADDADAQLRRADLLLAKGAISTAEHERLVVQAKMRMSELRSAQNSLAVVREGALRGSGDVATEVRSTVSGMVLAVPVKVGESIIESNTFNAGTTIATVADMSDLIFVGNIDESEVGRLHEGMDLTLTIGAMRDLTFNGTLEYISPLGIIKDGSVNFEIKAALVVKEDVFIRSGSSANANIVLQEVKNVPAINEAAIQYDEGAAFVELQTSEQVFKRQEIELGLSDGIYVQVLSGLKEGQEVKQVK